MDNSSHPSAKRPSLFASRSVRVVLGIVLAAAALYVGYRWLDRRVDSVEVVLTPEAIPADGVTSALLEIRLVSRFGNRLSSAALPKAPTIELTEGSSLVRVVPLDDSLRYRLVAGFDRGRVVVHVRVPGVPAPYEQVLLLTPSLADRNRNGYPDVVDLTSRDDRSAFRRWFVAIALGQLTHLDDQWSDRDCAGLLRYCFREALKRHDNTWLASRRWLVSAAIPDVAKYNYPKVPVLGTRVFNAGSKALDAAAADTVTPVVDVGGVGNVGVVGDLTGVGDDGDLGGVGDVGGDRNVADAVDVGTRDRLRLEEFSTFAEAARLKDNSMFFVSRDPEEAMSGDVLYYLNDTRSAWPYHTMVYVGGGMTVYHTGPDGDHPGIVKRMTFAQLASHPNPRWHPVAANPYFLGFYRWRILA